MYHYAEITFQKAHPRIRGCWSQPITDVFQVFVPVGMPEVFEEVGEHVVTALRNAGHHDVVISEVYWL